MVTWQLVGVAVSAPAAALQSTFEYRLHLDSRASCTSIWAQSAESTLVRLRRPTAATRWRRQSDPGPMAGVLLAAPAHLHGDGVGALPEGIPALWRAPSSPAIALGGRTGIRQFQGPIPRGQSTHQRPGTIG